MTTNIDRAAEVIGQHVNCGWSICDRRRRSEDGKLPPLDACGNTYPSCRDVAEGIAVALADAGLLALADDGLLAPDPPLPDPLFGARATHPEYGEGIVASHRPENDGRVWFIFPSEAVGSGTQSRWVEPSTLTFHTPDHPEFLETEEDYRTAPEGTIVAGNDAVPKVLLDGMWRHIYLGSAGHDAMAGIRRRVLRWGWEA